VAEFGNFGNFYFPGFTVGIRFAVFHLLGKTPLRRQPLYMEVINLGKTSKAHSYTSPVIPSSPGA